MRRDRLMLSIRWSLGLLVALPCHLVHAQAGDVPVLENAATQWLKCLTPAASALEPPVYPSDALKLNLGAIVKARLKFKKPDRAPEVDVYYNTGGLVSFENVVRTRVSAYRLPCMPSGAVPIQVEQTFTFSPHDDRPVVGSDVDEDDAHATRSSCRLVASGEKLPSYPTMVSTLNRSGAVVVEVTFAERLQPPITRIVYKSGSGAFVESVEQYVKQYRADCDGEFRPVTTLQPFRFRMEGDRQYGLKNLTLQQFVGAIRKVEQHRVRFDLGKMGCPFDVRFSLYRPHADNAVAQVGAANPARKEFIQWLRRVELDIPPKAYDDVLGQTINVSVPCGELDLT